jgi:hypothetical protein
MEAMRVVTALAFLAVAACDDTVGGVKPVGGDQPSQAELARFARHLHLDLAGRPPDDAYLDDAVAQLTTDDSVDARLALADDLIGDDAWAELYVGELENRVFGGETADARYQLLCGITRNDDPACNACAPPSNGDFCGTCSCPALTGYAAERDALLTAAEDLADGDSMSAVERRHLETSAFRFLSSADAIATSVFEVSLGHTPQAEERINASAMVNGALLPGSPAGILYHRHGASYDDLLDIVFESEVHREAMVGAVFERYLGRRPSGAELGYFTATLDVDDPDAREVILAVVSSREYFDQ